MAGCHHMFLSTGALLFLIIVPYIQVTGSRGSDEKGILDEILSPSNYDKRIRPSAGNGTDAGPTIVKVNMMLRDIQRIDDINMEWNVQLTFRTEWTDERLVFNDLGGRIRYLSLIETDSVWLPDVFFKTEKSGYSHNIITPNSYLRIAPDGRALHSTRVSLTLSCPMDLKLYPMDQQVCHLDLTSYGYTAADIVFLWKEYGPIQITKNVHLPRFTLQKFQTDYCNSKTNTGEYSCLRLNLLFKRSFSYYFLTIYTPIFMLVVVSWVSFWLERKALSARVTLSSLTLFAMVWLTTGLNDAVPPVSYTKALDVWTGWCMVFVFGALMENAVVNYISHWGLNVHPQHENLSGEAYGKVSRFSEIARKIDVTSRISFPILFALFNIVYWSTYLNVDSSIMYFDESATSLV